MIYNIIMAKSKRISTLKEVLLIILISLIGCSGVIFVSLYLDTFSSGFLFNYKTLIVAVSVSLITIITVFTIILSKKSDKLIYKLCFLSISFIALILCALYILNVTGLLDKFDSVDEFREYVSSFGNYAIVLFIIIQFLQVVVLPIPSFITVGA